MTPQLSPQDRDLLISRCLDGISSGDELRQLDGLIKADPEVGREMVRMAAQDVMVISILEQDSAVALLQAESDGAVSQDQSVPADLHDPVRFGKPAREKRSAPKMRKPFLADWFAWVDRWRWVSLGAAAAGLAIMLFGFWAWLARDESATVVAAIGQITGNMPGRVWKLGDILHPGDTIRTGAYGYLKFSYRDGSVVELDMNTVCDLTKLERTSAKALRLETGSLAARIKKQPASQSMTFATPQALATIVGTALRISATPSRTDVGVQAGRIVVEAKGIREVVSTGESISVQDGGFQRYPARGIKGEDIYEDGDLLFLDTFQNGLMNWTAITKQSFLSTNQNSKNTNSDAKVVEVVRNGIKKRVVSLTSYASQLGRGGIVSSGSSKIVDAFSLSYDYAFDGKPRHAMEGIELDRTSSQRFPPKLDGTFPQMARPPGEWNNVRWENVKKTDPSGRKYWDSKLIFNGELICRRTEYGYPEKQPPSLCLEVTDGELRFDNVQIREMNKVGASASSK